MCWHTSREIICKHWGKTMVVLSWDSALVPRHLRLTLLFSSNLLQLLFKQKEKKEKEVNSVQWSFIYQTGILSFFILNYKLWFDYFSKMTQGFFFLLLLHTKVFLIFHLSTHISVPLRVGTHQVPARSSLSVKKNKKKTTFIVKNRAIFKLRANVQTDQTSDNSSKNPLGTPRHLLKLVMTGFSLATKKEEGMILKNKRALTQRKVVQYFHVHRSEGKRERLATKARLGRR